MFKIISLRHSWHERKGFRLLRERGTDDYVFIHFISPVNIILDNEDIQALPHSCIIFPPHSYHEFYTIEEQLNHDWIHFLPPGEGYLENFRLPVNRLFFPKDTGFITTMTSTMELEFINRPPLWELHVDGLMTCLLSLLGREVVQNDNRREYLRKDKEKFDRLRLEIHNTPSAKWTMDNMAVRLGLCRSRFSVLYKQFYGVSPVEDLIETRIERAKYLLTINNMSVCSVADEAGYCNVEHFIRQFKARTGYSPTEYRRKE